MGFLQTQLVITSIIIVIISIREDVIGLKPSKFGWMC